MHLGAADALLEKLPAKPRALAQVAHLLALLFGSTAVAALGLSRWVEVGLSAALVVWGVALVRPLSEWRAGRLARALLLPLGLLAAVGGGLLVGSPLFAERPVLGIGMKDLAEGVQVTSVHPGFPAEGALVVGDELLAVDGNSLGKARPSHELRRLVRDRAFAASGSTRLSLRRGGLATEVTLAIPERRALNLPPLLLAALRALAVLLATFVFLKSDAQGLHHLGLRRAGAAREAAWAVPGLFFTYSVHLGVSIVVGVALLVSRGMGSQLKERSEGIAAIESLTASIPAPALLLALVWLAAFEEVVFRGFFLPRLRLLTGRWWLAVLVSCVLFGLGHLYEGRMAVVQTAAIGGALSALFLWRGRLEAPIFAHAAFNAFNLALLMALRQSGLLERVLPK